MKTLRQRYPFSAIVGQEELKQALLLNLIYPGIGGVLIRGEKGTAKSTAVRALEAILPEIDVVDGCPCGCDPHGDALCPWCLEQEALAAAVASHQEPERRASVGDEVQVVQERLDLARAPDGDVGQPDARHHAALQRVDDDGRHAAGDLGLRGAGRIGRRFGRAGGCGVVHAATIPLTSSM